MAFDYDLFVIGAGSGGVRAARIAAGHGARVGIAEDYRVGGTCVIRGCVPKKLLVYGSQFARRVRGCGRLRLDGGEPTLRLGDPARQRTAEIDRLNGVYLAPARERRREAASWAAAGCGPPHGRGRRRDASPPTRSCRHRRPARRAADARASSTPSPRTRRSTCRALPKRIVIVGGGYIAVEFAGIFNGLGCEVDIVIRRDRVLRGFDEECRTFVHEALKASGISMRTETEIERIERPTDGKAPFSCRTPLGGMFETDLVMYATGRVPNTAGIGLEKAGVQLDKAGAIAVDEWSQTTVDNIWAVGDVTDRINLTPVAIMEGHCFADTEFGNKPRKADHRNVPSAVFCQPEMANVGLTEEEARQTLGELRVYTAAFTPMKYTLAGRKQRTLMKLIVEAATDRVVGCHMVGDDAAEMIQGLAVAVKAGATKAQFDATVGHPPDGRRGVRHHADHGPGRRQQGGRE